MRRTDNGHAHKHTLCHLQNMVSVEREKTRAKPERKELGLGWVRLAQDGTFESLTVTCKEQPGRVFQAQGKEPDSLPGGVILASILPALSGLMTVPKLAGPLPVPKPKLSCEMQGTTPSQWASESSSTLFVFSHWNS